MNNQGTTAPGISQGVARKSTLDLIEDELKHALGEAEHNGEHLVQNHCKFALRILDNLRPLSHGEIFDSADHAHLRAMLYDTARNALNPGAESPVSALSLNPIILFYRSCERR